MISVPGVSTEIRLYGTTTPEFDAQSAAFYLNSDYLRPLKTAARLHSLVDPASPDADPPVGDPAKLRRQRIRRRDRLADLEPIALYNEASADYGDVRFLGFYRVLEFYFQRASVAEIGRLRRDPSVSDATLLSKARLDRELPQLQAVLRTVLTISEGSSVVEYAKHHRLATAKTLDQLGEALYRHRNNLVHAKESQIQDARIPNPFADDASRGTWAWIAELCAAKAIRRLSARRDA